MVAPGSLLQGACDIGKPSPESAAFELEAEVAIEAGGVLGRGIDDHSAGTELATSSHAASQRVDEEMTAER